MNLLHFVLVVFSLSYTSLAQNPQCDISSVQTSPICPQTSQRCFIQSEGFYCLPSSTQGCFVDSNKVEFQPIITTSNTSCFHCESPSNPSLRDKFLKWAFGPNASQQSPYFGNCASNTLFCDKDNICKEKFQDGNACSDTLQCSSPGTCRDGTCQSQSKWDKVKTVVYTMLSILFCLIVLVVAFFVFCSRNTIIFCPI
ncbi:hypothetical protein K7432_016029 [Basidiobolus ranarum]|uniref:Transmembrane protein n=1 Tax=Basidiobolus ranarum TaxID=34480 RepID=A0ABR2WFC1_9FUNG